MTPQGEIQTAAPGNSCSGEFCGKNSVLQTGQPRIKIEGTFRIGREFPRF